MTLFPNRFARSLQQGRTRVGTRGQLRTEDYHKVGCFLLSLTRSGRVYGDCLAQGRTADSSAVTLQRSKTSSENRRCCASNKRISEPTLSPCSTGLPLLPLPHSPKEPRPLSSSCLEIRTDSSILTCVYIRIGNDMCLPANPRTAPYTIQGSSWTIFSTLP